MRQHDEKLSTRFFETGRFSEALRKLALPKALSAGLIFSELAFLSGGAGAVEVNESQARDNSSAPPAATARHKDPHTKKRFIFQSENFYVTAPSRESAKNAAETLEACRRDLAKSWLGKFLPPWRGDCHVKISFNDGTEPPKAHSRYRFGPGYIYGLKMEINSSYEKALEDIIPHEVMHLVLVDHFNASVPAWIGEGVACVEESRSTRIARLDDVWRRIKNDDLIPLEELFSVSGKPAGKVYEAAHSLTTYLVAQGGGGYEGRARFLAFAKDLTLHNLKTESAIRRHYGFPNLALFEERWRAWVDAREPGWSLDPDSCKTALEPYRWRKTPDSEEKDTFASH